MKTEFTSPNVIQRQFVVNLDVQAGTIQAEFLLASK